LNAILGNSNSRWRAAVLAAWAAGLALLLAHGKNSSFVRVRPLLLATVVILVLFLVSMVVRPAAGSRLKLATWLRGAILLIPLIYMYTFAASSLNSDALQQRVTEWSLGSDGLAADSGSVATAPNDAGKPLNLLYLINHRKQLAGSHVVVDGRIFRDTKAADGQAHVYLYRFVMVCCAADARPVELQLDSPKAQGLQDDQWVRAGGIMRIDTDPKDKDREFLVIVPDSLQPIDSPEEPYLSPSSMW